MDYREKFYKKYVSKNTKYLYGKLSVEDIKKQFPIWQKYFGNFLPKDNNASIIELGCGNGGLIFWLQSLGYIDVSGIDTSLEQVEYARSLGIKKIDQANLVNFLKDKFEIYDVIFMRDVIEHFNKNEILEILELLYLVLKQGGLLIVQTPNGGSIFSGRYRYYDFTHEMSFTENSLRQLLLLNNFSDLEFREVEPVIHGLKSFIRFIFWKITRFILKLYLLIETGSFEKILTQNIIAIGKK